jgi:hypothetical protein
MPAAPRARVESFVHRRSVSSDRDLPSRFTESRADCPSGYACITTSDQAVGVGGDLLGAAEPLLSGLLPRLEPWTSYALWWPHITARPTDGLADAALADVIRQRLAPFLVRAIAAESAQRSVQITEFQRRQLSAAAFRSQLRTSSVVNRSAPILKQLTNVGISWAVTKGPGIAASYTDPTLRVFDDLDIVVSVRDFPRALGVLRSAGLEESPGSELPRESLIRLCREAVNLHNDGGASIDLHDRVPPWLWTTRLTPAEIITASTEFDVLGHQLRCASLEHNLLIASLHVVSDRNRPGASLLIWRDLVELGHAVNVDSAVDVATRLGLGGWLLGTLLALPAQVRPDDLVGALKDSDPQLPHRGRLRYLLSLSDHASVVVTQTARLPAWRGAVFVAAMAFPSRRFLRVRGLNLRSWWLSALHGPSRRT